MENSKQSNLVLGSIGDQIESLKNAFDDDASDPEIRNDKSEERDFEIDFDSKTEKKKSTFFRARLRQTGGFWKLSLARENLET